MSSIMAEVVSFWSLSFDEMLLKKSIYTYTLFTSATMLDLIKFTF